MVDETSSGPVDPHKLLKALSPLLNNEGGAKGIPEVVRITKLMKDSKKLVSRCVYISVLKFTKDDDILKKFIATGGWDILNSWLQENKTEECFPFLLELLRLYQHLPVTIDLLKKNNCAKTVKQLSKIEDERVKNISADIVNLWMEKIKMKSSDDIKSNESSKHRHKHHKEKHKDRPKDGKDHHHSHSHKKHSPHKDEKHVRRDSTGEGKEINQETVDSDSSSASLVANTTTGKSKDNHQKKASKEENEKSRSSVIKVAPHKFRSTGLEQENNLPLSKKKKVVDKSAVKRPSSSKPQPNSQPPEKKTKPATSSAATTGSNISTSPVKANIGMITQEETHGKIKLIPPKPRPPPAKEVYESTGFMDAITTTYVPSLPKVKKKKIVPVSKPGSKAANGPTSPTSPPTPTPTSPNDKPVMPSFYKDTLEMPTSPVEDDEKNSDTKESGSVKEDKDDDVKSIHSEASSDTGKKKKKKVTWASEKDLKSFFYFELDETERVNVNKLKSFEDIKKHEMMMERQAIESAKKLHDDSSHSTSTQGTIPWRTPPLISGLPPQTTAPGCNSTEIETQHQREQGVLQALFFSKHMIPDSPAEPDPEGVEYEEPKIIPLDDESGGGETFMDFSTTNEPTKPQPSTSHNQTQKPSQGQAASVAASQFSLPPDIASMLSTMAEQYQGGSNAANAAGNPQTSAASANKGDTSQGLPKDMQNMLQSIMGNNQQSNNDNDEWMKQLKTMVEPFKDQIQGMLQGNNTGGNMNFLQGGFPQGGMPQQMPAGDSLLGAPPMPYGPPGMPPPNFMGAPPMGPPPMGPMMGYGPGPGPMFRGRGPRPMGPMHGGRGGPMGMRPTNKTSTSQKPCRHYMNGTCGRGGKCAFSHQISNNSKKS